LLRRGKGGRRREVGMDEWGWALLRPWLTARAKLPAGPLFCLIDGRTRGRPWSAAGVRSELRRLAACAGVRRRLRRISLRHAHALELAREGVPLIIIQRQLGHTKLGTTRIYLQGIAPEEIITAVRTRPAPMMSVSAGLRLSPTAGSGRAPLRSRFPCPKTTRTIREQGRPAHANRRRRERRHRPA
jgi:hypothetical protein